MKRNNIEKCRSLRKHQTNAEKKLWLMLKNRQLYEVKFRRQFPIGNCIVDFYSPAYRLGIEIDGGQHYEDKGHLYDEARTRELSKVGVTILRFTNYDVLNNIEGVYMRIREIISAKENTPPHLAPLPLGERTREGEVPPLPVRPPKVSPERQEKTLTPRRT